MAIDAYDFWLLDLDGTLVDVETSYVTGVFDRVGDRLGREFTDHQARAIWYGLDGGRDGHLLDCGLDPDRFWEVFHDVEDPVARAEATYLYDDASFVGDLDVPVGLVTHCQSYLAGPVLEHVDIGDWFDAVVCCTEETGWKPDPAPVELAMGQLGVGADDQAGVLAGDGRHDVGAARNAGLDGVHVQRHDHSLRGDRVVSDYRVGGFDELHTPPGGVDRPAADGAAGHSP